MTMRLLYIGAALTFTIALIWLRPTAIPYGNTTATVRTGPADLYPPADVQGATNPAITQATISQTICNPKWSTKTIRPPTSYTKALKISQLYKYYPHTGVTQDPSLYEEDHLISLELGGNPRSPANLWPEPYTASIPDGGAHSKDAVENALHKQVCLGTISLHQAQVEIVSDWYKYRPAQTYGAVENSVDTDDE